jgi:hypothetical protein
MNDQITAYLQLRKNLLLALDDNLIENPFENDEEANREDGNDLKE